MRKVGIKVMMLGNIIVESIIKKSTLRPGKRKREKPYATSETEINSAVIAKRVMNRVLERIRQNVRPGAMLLNCSNASR
jgi:hypothetical protein